MNEEAPTPTQNQVSKQEKREPEDQSEKATLI